MAQHADYIIVGAGICGLSIARELLKQGHTVILLEARDRVGGRIHTLHQHFAIPLDLGAEFIHGDLPLTQALMKEAGAELLGEEGEFYRTEKGKLVQADDFFEARTTVEKKLKELETDMPFQKFLDTYFNSEADREVCLSVTRFVEGFDAADADRISAFSVLEEWQDGSTEAYRIRKGYGPLIELLYRAVVENKGTVHLNTIVQEIAWKADAVSILSEDGKKYTASKAIVTVPLGVLTSAPAEKGHIRFLPAIPAKLAAAAEMGYGPVVKVSLQFREKIWDHPDFTKTVTQLPELGFLITDQPIAVWWTQDLRLPLITGWVGGPMARELKDESEETLLTIALRSLADALHTSETVLRDHLLVHCVSNWAADPFSRGAYSYTTLATSAAKATLLEPLANTVFFAGEALTESSSIGTVEAALTSAQQALRRLLA